MTNHPASQSHETDDSQHDEVSVSVPGTSGHHDPGARSSTVDDVMEETGATDAQHVTVSVPRGDVEALDRAKQRIDEESVRAVGSTVLVEGTPKESAGLDEGRDDGPDAT
jgi:hypothetical protein